MEKIYEGHMEVTRDEQNVESIDGQFGTSTCHVSAGLDITIMQLAMKFMGLKKCLSSHGYNSESKEYNAEVHSNCSMGQKFADYIHYLKADENAYKKKILKQCESTRDRDVCIGKLMLMYKGIQSERSPRGNLQRWNHPKMPLAQKKGQVVQNKASFVGAAAA
ncbi:hypothetical protein A6R68_04775, partial [Neotoma lepida]